MRQSHQTLGLVLGLIAVIVFGGSLPATRLAVADLDPWFVTAGRAAIGGIVGLAYLAATRAAIPWAHLRRLTLISTCLVIGFPAALSLASVTVPASHGGVILALLPLTTAIAAVVLAGERPSPFFWLLSVIGGGLVAAFAFREGDVSVVTGDLYLVLAISLTGIGYTLSGVMARTMSGTLVIAWACVISLPLAIVATLALWPGNVAAVPFTAWAGLIYGGVMSQFVGYALWNAALAVGGVSRIGQLQLLQPFITFVIAAAFVHERIDATMIAFAAAVVVVVALGRRAAIGQRSEPAG